MDKTTAILLFATALALSGTGCVKTDVAAEPAAEPVAAEPAKQPTYLESVGVYIRPVLPGVLYAGTPTDLELLDEKGSLALYCGRTAEDAAFVAAELERDPETPMWRNSLFLLRPTADGGHEWRVILTSGTTWKNSRGEDSWPEQDTMYDLKMCLHVLDAKFSPDKRHIWLTLDPHTYTCFYTCSYDLRDNVLRILEVGGTFEVEADGTLRIKDVKTYLSDENGEPLGAFFYDEWITPDGTEVRRSELH